MSQHIYGFHDPGGEQLMIDAGKPGWVMVTEAIGLGSPAYPAQEQYRYLSDVGIRVIVRLNHGYGPDGTIPYLADQCAMFARACGHYVASSSGCSRWVIGNEPNHPQEWPSGQMVTPRHYAWVFHLCRCAIKRMPGHETDEVLVAAVAPWTAQAVYPENPSGDWIVYWQQVLAEIDRLGSHDGITLHTYTHGNNPEAIYNDVPMLSFPNRQYEFRAYRDFLNAVPVTQRHKPAYLTEMNQDAPWSGETHKTEWVQRAYGEIDWWNSQPGTQKIHCALLYRWLHFDRWGIEGNASVIADFRRAMECGYRFPPLTGRSAGLSPVAERLYWRIVDYKAAHDGNSPSMREMTKMISRSLSVVRFHLEKLDAAGWIEMAGSVRARSIRVVGGEWRLLGGQRSAEYEPRFITEISGTPTGAY